ncbi:MAG: hypothetical protein JSR95_07375 [Proteobacteria bacterium]|nr:hypothetical protein [Pseudomonadota bacterium]
MVINMNEAQVRTVEQVREVLSGIQGLEFRPSGDDARRYGWIGAVLKRVGYRQLERAERGVVRAYLKHFSGYSRAQLTLATFGITASMPQTPSRQSTPCSKLLR